MRAATIGRRAARAMRLACRRAAPCTLLTVLFFVLPIGSAEAHSDAGVAGGFLAGFSMAPTLKRKADANDAATQRIAPT